MIKRYFYFLLKKYMIRSKTLKREKALIFYKLGKSVVKGNASGRVQQWQPPPVGFVKVSIDAAFNCTTGIAGLGSAMERDGNGYFIIFMISCLILFY